MQPESEQYNAYFEQLKQAGIDPRLFAAIVSQFMGSTPPPPTGSDNVPGFEYVQRVSAAALHAVLAHGEEANRAWSELRRGRFGIGAALQSWTKVVENYAGVVTEGLRFTPQPAQPAWLFIPYSKKNPPTTKFSLRIDTTREPIASLHFTEFEGPAPVRSAAPGSGRVKSVLYKKGIPEVVGNRVEFNLDHSQVQQLDDGTQHTAFVYRKGMGAAPPVAVVVVQVTA
jgi:hypothetical protein